MIFCFDLEALCEAGELPTARFALEAFVTKVERAVLVVQTRRRLLPRQKKHRRVGWQGDE